MKLVTRTQWGARPPRSVNAGQLNEESTGHWNGPTVTVQGQTEWDHVYCASIIRGVQNYHMDGKGWWDLAYNFIICPHGHIHEGRGLNVKNGANGTNEGNRTSHAIMFLEGEGNRFTEESKDAFRACVAYIAENTGAPNNVALGHRDHKATACPGDQRYSWIHAGMPIPVAETPEEPWPQFKPAWGLFGLFPFATNKPMIAKGDTGMHVEYLQGVLHHGAKANIGIDGDFGPKTDQSVKNLQRYFKLKADGIVGPKTWEVVDYVASFA